jgi:hypothetical protein
MQWIICGTGLGPAEFDFTHSSPNPLATARISGLFCDDDDDRPDESAAALTMNEMICQTNETNETDGANTQIEKNMIEENCMIHCREWDRRMDRLLQNVTEESETQIHYDGEDDARGARNCTIPVNMQSERME